MRSLRGSKKRVSVPKGTRGLQKKSLLLQMSQKGLYWESPLLRELEGLLVSSPEESVRLQKESPLLRELEGLLGILEEPFAPDVPKKVSIGSPRS